MKDDFNFLSDSCEERGRFSGISENVGYFMTFKILVDDTSKIIHYSNIRSNEDIFAPNLRIDPITIPMVIKSKNKIASSVKEQLSETDPPNMATIIIIKPKESVGRSFLMPKDENGQVL